MTPQELHLKRLVNLYYAAPVQQYYTNINIEINSESTIISWPVNNTHFHGGNALHGAGYFKLLDDAAYFAAAALHPSNFIVTAGFSIKFLHPVADGVIKAIGKISKAGQHSFQASAELFNESGTQLATGSGTFVATSTLWNSLEGYTD